MGNKVVFRPYGYRGGYYVFRKCTLVEKKSCILLLSYWLNIITWCRKERIVNVFHFGGLTFHAHFIFHVLWLAKRVYYSSFNFSVGINGNGYNTVEQMKQSVGQKVAVIVAQQLVAIGLRKHQIGYGGLQSPFKSRGFWSSRTSQTEEFSTERPLGQKGKSRGGIERV